MNALRICAVAAGVRLMREGGFGRPVRPETPTAWMYHRLQIPRSWCAGCMHKQRFNVWSLVPIGYYRQLFLDKDRFRDTLRTPAAPFPEKRQLLIQPLWGRLR